MIWCATPWSRLQCVFSFSCNIPWNTTVLPVQISVFENPGPEDLTVHLSVESLLTLNSFPASGDFCRLLITFVNSLDPDQAQQNVRPDLDPNCLTPWWGWSGGAKVLCILHHWGVQLILAYSWARPAILVVGKGRGGMFLFLLFLHFHSCSSFFPVPLFHLLYSLFYLFSPFL